MYTAGACGTGLGRNVEAWGRLSIYMACRGGIVWTLSAVDRRAEG
jgi:hypothetical protein